MTDEAEREARTEQIRRRFFTTFPNPDVLSGETATAIRDLLTHIDALKAQHEAEFEKALEQALDRAEQAEARVRALREVLATHSCEYEGEDQICRFCQALATSPAPTEATGHE